MMASSEKKYENLSSGSCYDCLDVVLRRLSLTSLEIIYLMGKSFLRFVRNCKTDIDFRKGLCKQ